MAFERVEYRRLYEGVIKQIENMISSGELSAGDRLPSERELVEQIGVSRGTLREAFRVLERQGIIETRPGGGRVIKALPPESTGRDLIRASLENAAVMDLLAAREIVESAIVELACDRATGEDLQAIEDTLKSEEAGLLHDRASIGSAFHCTVADACHNPILSSIRLELDLRLLGQHQRMILESPERLQERCQQHREIFEAISARDPVRARQAVLQNLRSARRHLGLLGN